MAGGFWQRVLASDLAVPPDRPLPELTAELVTMLGSSDPFERDDLASRVLATWIGEGVYDDLLITFGDSLCTGLRAGLGESGTDSVFRRSFSALVLTACVERDNREHLLPVDVVLGWADPALGWFTRERDLRGWVQGSGWAHAVAHGADLIAAFARSRHLEAAHLGVLLDVIAERLAAPTATVLVDGEDDRLAHATLVLLRRNLVDQSTLDDWVGALGVALEQTSQNPGLKPGPTPSACNTSAFLRALYVHLAIGIPATGQDGRTSGGPRHPECRSDLMLALLQAIPRHSPWLYSSVASRDD
jgi:hypothetical protein